MCRSSANAVLVPYRSASRSMKFAYVHLSCSRRNTRARSRMGGWLKSRARGPPTCFMARFARFSFPLPLRLPLLGECERALPGVLGHEHLRGQRELLLEGFLEVQA